MTPSNFETYKTIFDYYNHQSNCLNLILFILYKELRFCCMLVTCMPDEMCIHSHFYCQETFPAHLKDDMEMSGIDSAITETLVLEIT